jgi:hypothetical protein
LLSKTLVPVRMLTHGGQHRHGTAMREHADRWKVFANEMTGTAY